MAKTIKRISILFIALIISSMCLMLAGCDGEVSPTINVTGEASAVDVGGTLEDALANCTLQILSEDGSTWVTVTAEDGTEAKGYQNMRKAGAYITWSGSSAYAKEQQTNGKQLVISITYNLETISLNYKIN